jgi:uncharacterized membrane protein
MPMQTSTTTSPLFSATLRPDRNLTMAGGWLTLVIAGVVAVPVVIAAPDFLLPGMAAFVLATAVMTVLSVRKARSARFEEKLVVWPDQVEITISRPGETQTLRRFDPKSVRLVLDRDENERTLALRLRHGSEEIEIGAFLAVGDRSSFARAFGQALRRARRG